MKPVDRVLQIIKYKNLSISGFEKATGLSNNSIQTAIKRKSNLKDETLNIILNTFTDISAEWLLTGKGNMLEVDKFKNESVNFIGKDKSLNVEDFLDVFFLYEDIIIKKERFQVFLESQKKDAIIKYQHELLTKAKQLNNEDS